MLLLVGCSGSDASGQPAGSAPASVATFGVPAKLGDLDLNVTDPTVGGDDRGPWLTVTVQADNKSGVGQRSPSFEIHCSGNPQGGSSQVSTYQPSSLVAAGSSDDGKINLLLPGDGRGGQPRPACAAPAVVLAIGSLIDRLELPIPAPLLANMNATPQPGSSASTTTFNVTHSTEVQGAEG